MFKNLPDKQNELMRFVQDRLNKANDYERVYMQMGFDLYLQVHNLSLAYLHDEKLSHLFGGANRNEVDFYREMTIINLFVASQTLRWGFSKTSLINNQEKLIEVERRILDFMHEVFLADITLHFGVNPGPEESHLQKRFSEYLEARKSKEGADGAMLMTRKMVQSFIGRDDSTDLILEADILDMFEHFKRTIPEMISYYNKHAKILSL